MWYDFMKVNMFDISSIVISRIVKILISFYHKFYILMIVRKKSLENLLFYIYRYLFYLNSAFILIFLL